MAIPGLDQRYEDGPPNREGPFHEKILSPTSYSYKFETSPDGNNWTAVMDGKETKVK